MTTNTQTTADCNLPKVKPLFSPSLVSHICLRERGRDRERERERDRERDTHTETERVTQRETQRETETETETQRETQRETERDPLCGVSHIARIPYRHF